MIATLKYYIAIVNQVCLYGFMLAQLSHEKSQQSLWGVLGGINKAEIGYQGPPRPLLWSRPTVAVSVNY